MKIEIGKFTVHIPDEPLYLHSQATGWVGGKFPDLGESGALIVAMAESVTGDGAPPWGDLLSTFQGARHDRASLCEARIRWVQQLPIRDVGRIVAAINTALTSNALSEDERKN